MSKSRDSRKRSKPGRDSSKPSSDKKLSPKVQETLEHLLDRLGIGDDWDFLLVGDGSGSNWSQEAGWASVSVEKLTMERMVWTGGVNRGTVNVAEVMACLIPLTWLAAREEDRRTKHKTRRTAYRVHIVTDSQYTRDTGAGENRMVSKNAGLWAVFDVFVRQGFVLNWHWIRRGTCELNRYTDDLSKLARILFKKNDLPARLENKSGRSVYDVNP